MFKYMLIPIPQLEDNDFTCANKYYHNQSNQFRQKLIYYFLYYVTTTINRFLLCNIYKRVYKSILNQAGKAYTGC